jgi:hypothetical protein
MTTVPTPTVVSTIRPAGAARRRRREVAPRCDPSKPFGAPAPVAELNSGDYDQYPTAVGDEQVILFARGGDFPANMKIYWRSEPIAPCRVAAGSHLAGRGQYRRDPPHAHR